MISGAKIFAGQSFAVAFLPQPEQICSIGKVRWRICDIKTFLSSHPVFLK